MTAPARPAAPKRDSYHHNDLRDAVIAKAVEFISERGGPTFSLRELATSLGVSHAAVYRHFSDKDGLLECLTELGFREMRRYQQAAQAGAGDAPLGQLSALCSAYLNFAVEQRGYFALMFHASPISEATAAARDRHNADALDALVSTIRAAQANGDIVAGDPERIAAYLVLAPHGLASFQSQGHIPAFIAHHDPGPITTDWLALLILQPLLTKPLPPDEVTRRFLT